MKKRIIVITAILVMAITGTACGTEKQPTEDNSTTVQRDNTENQELAANASEDAAKKDTAEGTVTGVVDVNKGFMITVISDSDGEPYVFPLDEAQSKEYESIKKNDKVTVSYTNGLPDMDNLETVVTGIKVN